MSEGRFRPGDRVVHIRPSMVPEGAKGTVLGPTPLGWQARGYMWEVEYDDHPNPGNSGLPTVRSPTSWFSRDTSIELTREAALARIKETT